MLVVCLFLYTHCLFSDTFLGFQLVCLLVSFSFSLKLCLIGEEDEHHHLVIEYTFWIQTDHHSFYILFFITSNNAKNMKDNDQILRHTVENVFPAFPISDQGHCDKRKDATPGGFFPIPFLCPFTPTLLCHAMEVMLLPQSFVSNSCLSPFTLSPSLALCSYRYLHPPCE